MFRAKRKETKWKRLNTIAELLTPPHNVGDETKARALIVDYLYDFYDGLERFKFPEERKDLVFRMSPKPFFASKESTSPEKVTSVLVLLYNSSEYGIVFHCVFLLSLNRNQPIPHLCDVS